MADIEAAVRSLRAAGVDVGEIQREPFGCFATFTDPDGYALQLFQPPTT